ncbi:DUF429 domain-containing protein [Microbacterium chocolatum]|uniref:DUF429 domain-containing protein n=1 Tax=Microbacterium aurantiacum TaxID=162393 RepID=UPI00338F53F3
MICVGIDLAAEPAATAVARLDADGTTLRLRDLHLGADDDAIVAAAAGADGVGIDCAFGWPAAFVEFVSAHAAGRMPETAPTGKDGRRPLAYRRTDVEVQRRTGRWPLSVSTDRLGLTAMRCAVLLDRFARAGEHVDRAGSGRFVEVYPAASLRIWGLLEPRYKVDPDARAATLDRVLAAAAPIGTTASQRELMVRSADAFDALIAALATIAHRRGRTHPVPGHLGEIAAAEGWIALPDGGLAEVLRG